MSSWACLYSASYAPFPVAVVKLSSLMQQLPSQMHTVTLTLTLPHTHAHARTHTLASMQKANGQANYE